MANTPNQKQRLLYLIKILLEKTDEENGLTTQQIIEELTYYGIDAERKALYRDMQSMRDFDLEVKQKNGKYWYLATRPFELQELIMLVDAVQSTPFLTNKMTDTLIKRLRAFASASQQKMLSRRIEVPSRKKMRNDEIFKNLDVIQQAMSEKRKVEFRYFRYDVKKHCVDRKAGNAFLVTPVRLVYAEEFYYLVAFMEKWANVEGHQPFTPFRVDRMLDVRLSAEPVTHDVRIAQYKTEEHLAPSFGVFAADVIPVALEVDTKAMNSVIDKFGLDVLTFENDCGRAQVYVKAPMSPQFFGWLLQLVPHAKIISPQRAIDEFKGWLDRAQKMYVEGYKYENN